MSVKFIEMFESKCRKYNTVCSWISLIIWQYFGVPSQQKVCRSYYILNVVKMISCFKKHSLLAFNYTDLLDQEEIISVFQFVNRNFLL